MVTSDQNLQGFELLKAQALRLATADDCECLLKAGPMTRSAGTVVFRAAFYGQFRWRSGARIWVTDNPYSTFAKKPALALSICPGSLRKQSLSSPRIRSTRSIAGVRPAMVPAKVQCGSLGSDFAPRKFLGVIEYWRAKGDPLEGTLGS